MRVLEIKDIQKRDLPIYYRKEFKASAVFECFLSRFERPVEFSIEHKPHGGMEVHVKILADIEYPLLPVVQTLKKYVAEMENRGHLP